MVPPEWGLISTMDDLVVVVGTMTARQGIVLVVWLSNDDGESFELAHVGLDDAGIYPAPDAAAVVDNAVIVGGTTGDWSAGPDAAFWHITIAD